MALTMKETHWGNAWEEHGEPEEAEGAVRPSHGSYSVKVRGKEWEKIGDCKEVLRHFSKTPEFSSESYWPERLVRKMEDRIHWYGELPQDMGLKPWHGPGKEAYVQMDWFLEAWEIDGLVSVTENAWTILAEARKKNQEARGSGHAGNAGMDVLCEARRPTTDSRSTRALEDNHMLRPPGMGWWEGHLASPRDIQWQLTSSSPGQR